MLNPLAVALQGLGFGSAQTALQGLLRYVKTSAGALAGNRPPTDTQRPQIPATARTAALTGPRAAALQTTTRSATADTDRTPDTATHRPAAAAPRRAAQTSSSARPANTGGRRK